MKLTTLFKKLLKNLEDEKENNMEMIGTDGIAKYEKLHKRLEVKSQKIHEKEVELIGKISELTGMKDVEIEDIEKLNKKLIELGAEEYLGYNWLLGDGGWC